MSYRNKTITDSAESKGVALGEYAMRGSQEARLQSVDIPVKVRIYIYIYITTNFAMTCTLLLD